MTARERVERMLKDAKEVREVCACTSENYPCARCLYSVEIEVECEQILKELPQ